MSTYDAMNKQQFPNEAVANEAALTTFRSADFQTAMNMGEVPGMASPRKNPADQYGPPHPSTITSSHAFRGQAGEIVGHREVLT